MAPTIAAVGVWLLLVCSGTAQDSLDWPAWKDQYEDHVKAKKDFEAIGALGVLVEKFSTLSEAHQKEAVKTVQRTLSRNRPEDEHALFVRVVESFSDFGPLGERELKNGLRHKTVKGRAPVLAEAVLGLASFRNPKTIDLIQDHLNHRDAEVVRAAAAALAEYRGQPESTRKRIVGELVKTYGTIYSNSLPSSQVGRKPGQPIRRPDENRYEVVKDAFEESLGTLTGQKISGSSQWYRWYNKNRKKKWDKADDS